MSTPYIKWTPEMDADLIQCVSVVIPNDNRRQGPHPASDDGFALRWNITRNAVQRRREKLGLMRKGPSAKDRAFLSPERERAGIAPLPAGHPITMGALRAAMEMRP